MHTKIILAFFFLSSYFSLLASEKSPLNNGSILTYKPKFLKINENLEKEYRYAMWAITPVYYHGKIVFEISKTDKRKLNKIIREAAQNNQDIYRLPGKEFGPDLYIHQDMSQKFIKQKAEEDFYNEKTVNFYNEVEEKILEMKNLRIKKLEKDLKARGECKSCEEVHSLY